MGKRTMPMVAKILATIQTMGDLALLSGTGRGSSGFCGSFNVARSTSWLISPTSGLSRWAMLPSADDELGVYFSFSVEESGSAAGEPVRGGGVVEGCAIIVGKRTERRPAAKQKGSDAGILKTRCPTRVHSSLLYCTTARVSCGERATQTADWDYPIEGQERLVDHTSPHLVVIYCLDGDISLPPGSSFMHFGDPAPPSHARFETKIQRR